MIEHYRNVVLTQFGWIFTWFSSANFEGFVKWVTMVVGVITVVVFGIKSIYDMLKSREEYIEKKHDNEEDNRKNT